MDNKKRQLASKGITSASEIQEFQSFHLKILDKSNRTLTLVEVIDLFCKFKERKDEARLAKIASDRKKLPVFVFRQKILDAVRDYQVILIAADTGAGKSTQVPQYLLESGLYDGIAVSQPRRIACFSLAKRVGQELQSWNKGSRSVVGYKVRFDGSSTRDTKVCFFGLYF
jgi:HrpA-like RNA helicase